MNVLRSGPGSRDERGAALITTILTLLLISVLVVTFLHNITTERKMAGNVHTGREALYSADAGIRVAQQNLANMARTRMDSLIALYDGNGPVLKTPSKVFPSGNITNSATTPLFSATTTVVFTDSLLSTQTQVYNYRYTVTATGTEGAGSRTVQSQGILKLSTGRGSFADYLMFTDKHTMPDGGKIWFTTSGKFEGRIHTNTQYRIQGSPTFMDLITSVNAKAWYYNNGNNQEVDDDHYKSVDVPKLYGGFKRNQPNVDLPTNSYSQQNAALGLNPADQTLPSNATIRTQIGQAVNSSVPPNGVYVVNSALAVTGGIYVQGTLTSCLMSVDGSGNQVYTMKQGATTWTITLNKAANTTTMVKGAATTIYTGMPRGIIYTVGSISDLGGPDRVSGNVPAGIADANQLLVAATGDIVLQNDLVYNDYFDGGSILGLFSSGGTVRVGTGAPNDCEIQSFVMSTASGGCMQVDNYNSGSPRGTIHLNGGIVSIYYGAFGTFGSDGKIKTGYARDFRYDDRGLIPPYFPSSSQIVANVPKARTLLWKEQ